MKVVVLGAGIIGVTTAYALHKLGLNVTVIERHSSAAQECSFANGGQLSYSHGQPWARPSILKYLPFWLVNPSAPIAIKTFDLRMINWLAKFLYYCRTKPMQEHTQQILELAQLSRHCLHRLLEEVPLHFDHRQSQGLHCYTSRHELHVALRQAQFQQTLGCSFRLLNHADDCLAFEPSLRFSTKPLVGGIVYPEDEAGDMYQFTSQLAQYLEQQGVQFLYNHTLEQIKTQGTQITHVVTNHGDITGDHYVLCTGAYSPILASELGVKLPIYPLKGYSISIPLSSTDIVPSHSITYPACKIVMTKLNEHLRIAGTAELAGYSHSIDPMRIAQLKTHARQFLPHLSNVEQATSWACLRPSTPSGLPLIGKTPYSNLLLNTGHGTLGWTLACGSAHKVAGLLRIHH